MVYPLSLDLCHCIYSGVLEGGYVLYCAGVCFTFRLINISALASSLYRAWEFLDQNIKIPSLPILEYLVVFTIQLSRTLS